MLQQNGFFICTFDHRSDHIAKLKIYFGIRMVFTPCFGHVLMETTGLRSIGYQFCEAVPAVYIDHRGEWTNAMSRTEIPVAIYGVQCTPLCFRKYFFAKLGAA